MEKKKVTEEDIKNLKKMQEQVRKETKKPFLKKLREDIARQRSEAKFERQMEREELKRYAKEQKFEATKKAIKHREYRRAMKKHSRTTGEKVSEYILGKPTQKTAKTIRNRPVIKMQRASPPPKRQMANLNEIDFLGLGKTGGGQQRSYQPIDMSSLLGGSQSKKGKGKNRKPPTIDDLLGF